MEVSNEIPTAYESRILFLFHPGEINGDRHQREENTNNNGECNTNRTEEPIVLRVIKSKRLQRAPEAVEEMPEERSNANQVNDHLNRRSERCQHHSI